MSRLSSTRLHAVFCLWMLVGIGSSAPLSPQDDSSKEARLEDLKSAANQDLSRRHEYLGQFMSLAEEEPATDVGLEALVWVVRYSGQANQRQERALELLTEYHIEDERLVKVCRMLFSTPSRGAQAFLVEVTERNPHRVVRGQAIYSLGVMYKRLAWKGEPYPIFEMESKEMETLAETFFERVLEQYADVKSSWRTLGQAAAADLFEIRKLKVGSEAPEILGRDTGGTEFSLRDYEGSVVLLTFWGRW